MTDRTDNSIEEPSREPRAGGGLASWEEGGKAGGRANKQLEFIIGVSTGASWINMSSLDLRFLSSYLLPRGREEEKERGREEKRKTGRK